MIRAMRAFVLVLATTATVPAFAQQTYKWVDERGVVNYSNVPKAKPAQALPIEERVSVVPRDPNLAAAAAASQAQGAMQAEYAHREWLARQQGMLQTQALAAMYAPPADYVSAGVRYVRGPVRRVVHHNSNTRRF
jgi:hypothetical protein